MSPPKPSVRIGLVLHPSRDAMPVAEKIARWARSHGSELLVDAKDAARAPDGVRPVPEDQLAQQADALVSLGGDGTMLGALRLAARRALVRGRRPRGVAGARRCRRQRRRSHVRHRPAGGDLGRGAGPADAPRSQRAAGPAG
jgi:hypothetical protein